jgi:hypothetical protein
MFELEKEQEVLRRQFTNKKAVDRMTRCFFICNRGERIRTSGLSAPNRARYQAALRPDKLT